MFKYNNVCIISKCNYCNSFSLEYKNVRVRLDLEALIRILTVAYQYDRIDKHVRQDKPFRIKVGAALLTICPKDYSEFESLIEEVVLENTDLSNIEQQNIFYN